MVSPDVVTCRAGSFQFKGGSWFVRGSTVAVSNGVVGIEVAGLEPVRGVQALVTSAQRLAGPFLPLDQDDVLARCGALDLSGPASENVPSWPTTPWGIGSSNRSVGVLAEERDGCSDGGFAVAEHLAGHRDRARWMAAAEARQK